MSFRFLSSLNSPPLVAATGVLVVAGLPFVPLGTSLSLGALKIANLAAFATNVTAVSVPGRMDGDQDARMRSGDLNPNAENTPLKKDGDDKNNKNNNNDNIVLVSREKTLVAPAGWAFAIWAPIYLGEAVFCASQYFDSTTVASLPELTAPFVAANVAQSLWCASFRTSYARGWSKYVSVLMLGGTALSLSQLPFITNSPYMIPLIMHFGWTTAATLVNLNGSIAMEEKASDKVIVSTGHASAVAAAALGVGITLSKSLPVYGLTIAWALAACVDGMRVKQDGSASEELKKGAQVQKALLMAGSILSSCASVYTWMT